MPDLLAKLDELPDLRPFPAIATKIMSAADDPRVGVTEITDLIACEPSIAVQVLKIANSPSFGFAREVRSINQAVVVLGGRAVRDIVITVASSDLFNSEGPAVEARGELWNHSLACGVLAGVLAEATGKVDKADAFLAGVLHDVGKLLFYDLEPEAYTEFEREQTSVSIIAAEEDAFGASHQDLGERCCDEWGLPNEVRDAVCFHHTIGEAFDSPEVTAIIGAANALSRHWEIGHKPNTSEDIANVDLMGLDLTGEQLETIRDTAESNYKNFCSAFA